MDEEKDTMECFSKFIEGGITLTIGAMFASKRIHLASCENVAKSDFDNMPPDDFILKLLNDGVRMIFDSGLTSKDTIYSNFSAAINNVGELGTPEEKEYWLNVYKNY